MACEHETMTDPTRFTVIIPAHNEAAVIERCLETALAGAPEGHETQFIVAANGCTDRTVELARAAAPDALVLDLAEGSKPLAMNAANAVALYYPRIYLDADVQCDYESLSSLARVLRNPGVMAGSPALKMDLSRCSPAMKSYYRVWQTQPYVTRNMVGSGCFGLSRAGQEEIGPFPPITGDDIWVHSRFREEERASVSSSENGGDVSFTVSPPRKVSDQIRVETRRRLGNQELMKAYPSPHYSGSNSASDLGLALKRGCSLVDVAIYLAIKAAVRLRVALVKRQQKTIVWERDETARNI